MGRRGRLHLKLDIPQRYWKQGDGNPVIDLMRRPGEIMGKVNYLLWARHPCRLFKARAFEQVKVTIARTTPATFSAQKDLLTGLTPNLLDYLGRCRRI